MRLGHVLNEFCAYTGTYLRGLTKRLRCYPESEISFNSLAFTLFAVVIGNKNKNNDHVLLLTDGVNGLIERELSCLIDSESTS